MSWFENEFIPTADAVAKKVLNERIEEIYGTSDIPHVDFSTYFFDEREESCCFEISADPEEESNISLYFKHYEEAETALVEYFNKYHYCGSNKQAWWQGFEKHLAERFKNGIFSKQNVLNGLVRASISCVMEKMTGTKEDLQIVESSERYITLVTKRTNFNIPLFFENIKGVKII